MIMDVEDVKCKKSELGARIAELLNGFEDDTGVEVSGVGFVRRVSYDELGREVDKRYVVEVKVEL